MVTNQYVAKAREQPEQPNFRVCTIYFRPFFLAMGFVSGVPSLLTISVDLNGLFFATVVGLDRKGDGLL
jgi:hypothetical protein